MKNKNTLRVILKTILWVYIILCIIIASLNYGFAAKAPEKVKEFITWSWHFYENWVKTIFIVVCSLLTVKILSPANTTMRRKNLIGFIVSALAIHIIAPIFLHNSEIYFFTMPLPWTTAPIQLLDPGSSFYGSRAPIWGLFGVSAVLVFYWCYTALVLLGTLLLGRRWQCATLCLFNGFASEVFAPAFPLIGRKKTPGATMMRTFSVLRWLFLAISFFFTVFFLLHIAGVQTLLDSGIIGKIETYKYLATELMAAMFFWVAFMGRGYCYYCPLGTVLGLLSKVAGQRIITNHTNCVQCARCNAACPMTIDIMGMAKDGVSVKSLRCVGCGHCVDACPTANLSYSTRFLSLVNKPKVPSELLETTQPTAVTDETTDNQIKG